MAEFEIEGKNYRSGRLDAFQQLHIARRLAPLIAKLAPEIQQQQGSTAETGFLSLLEPIIDGMAQMPEADFNYITERCLAVTRRRSGDMWAEVYNNSVRRMMFEDIDAMGVLVISFNVIQENLGNFMRAPALTSQSPSPTATANPGNLSPFQTVKTG